MFSSDTDRIIPRRRSKLGNLIILPFLLYVSIFLFFRWLIIDKNTTTWIGDPIIIFVIYFIAFSVFSSLIVFANRWFHFRRWTVFAEERGLPVKKKNWFSSPVILGTYRGHKITITNTRGNRDPNGNFTDFMIVLNNPTRHTFTIQKRSFTHVNRELTNDEVIDRKLTIKVNSKTLLLQILKTRKLRQGLLELGERARTRDLYLNGKVLHYKESGQVSDQEYLEAVLNYMIDMIKLVERVEQIGR